ncbi:MAG: aldehyde ferredoxin oxidoreductase [Chloroflexi bacterium]|nr:MAG: aldehyde ferredoxin oxidoreductase [Chloroflexota bacterium]
MGNGYWNQILRVDLTSGKVSSEEIGEEVWQQVIGGAGFGARVLLQETPGKLDPLSPDNRLIFAVGPLQSISLPGNAKWSVITKSPLTGTFLDSAGGAGWAPLFKGCGYDALIIQGRAEKPVYLWITEDEVEIRDAASFWGMDAVETPDVLKNEVGQSRASVVAIGPAGEKLLPIACIAADGHSFAGRGGAGAVMGSKNLKAVAVYGRKKTPVFAGEKAKTFAAALMQQLKRDGAGFRETGTPGVIIPLEGMGDTPIKYWTGDIWHEGAELLGTPHYTEVLNVKPWPCTNCPIGCHRHIVVKEPAKYAVEGSGPEYESLGMLGASCLVDDVKAVAKANDICNRQGIDSVSAGAFAGFLMECYEKGLITKEDTGGLEINWGDGDALIEVVKQVASGKGLGALFSEGIVGAAQRIGGGAEELTVHVKNLDFPAHDPRAVFGLAVNYATGTRGACHERGDPEAAALGLAYPELGFPEPPDRFDMDIAAQVAQVYQDASGLYNLLTICKFMVKGASLTLTQIKEVFNLITGWGWEMEDLIHAQERAFTLQRLVNVRDGISRQDDVLPKKMFVAAKEGGRAGKVPQSFEKALDEYYRLRGWDKNGIPTEETLRKLGLEKFISK